MFRQRFVYAALLLCGLLHLGFPGSARAGEEYLEDSRTAKSVAAQFPRRPLADLLKHLSGVSQVGLSADPSLAGQPLVAGIPARPLREAMDALAELTDGTWKLQPGNPAAYRLEPNPGPTRSREAARKAHLGRVRKALDDAAAEAAKTARGEALPTSSSEQRTLLLHLLWSHLTPVERDQVFAGKPVTATIPEARARREYALILASMRRENRKVVGPLLATFDLDDVADMALPTIRGRVTALRDDSLVIGIGTLDYLRSPGAGRPAPPPNGQDEGPTLPSNVGDNGRLTATRDELVLQVAEAAEVPILSRHRAGGALAGVEVGGRKLSQVISGLAAVCDARPHATSRGFYLLRSNTEPLDPLGYPTQAVVDAYLKSRPSVGKVVPFELLAPLAELSPLQLSVLQRSNLCTEEAGFVRETYALLRFYRLLTPAQKQALFSAAGLEVSQLAHGQLHALLDERAKRADFDIYEQLQELPDLRFRFRVQNEKDGSKLVMEALRDGKVATAADLELPVVSPEEAE